VERIWFEVDRGHLFVRGRPVLGILARVENAAHLEARRRSGGRNEADDRYMSEERLASPVL
jgi:hypothetical protein